MICDAVPDEDRSKVSVLQLAIQEHLLLSLLLE